MVLPQETPLIGSLADTELDATTSPDLRAMPSTLLHSVGGTVVLLVVLMLNVYKPPGMSRYGWRKQQKQRAQRDQRPLTVSPPFEVCEQGALMGRLPT